MAKYKYVQIGKRVPGWLADKVLNTISQMTAIATDIDSMVNYFNHDIKHMKSGNSITADMSYKIEKDGNALHVIKKGYNKADRIIYRIYET